MSKTHNSAAERPARKAAQAAHFHVMRHHMSLVEEIRQYWGWLGISPVEVVGENDFGNLIVKDEYEIKGVNWKIKLPTNQGWPKNQITAIGVSDNCF